MKEILLTRGYKTVVDDADFDWLSQFKWSAFIPTKSKTVYAGRVVDEKTVYMHRLITGEPPCKVDHKNRNGLDNQRENLRQATHSQNLVNSPPRGGSSAYKGVSKCKQTGKWKAEIRCNERRYTLGRFTEETDAALAYNDAAIKLFGEFAWLNTIPTEQS